MFKGQFVLEGVKVVLVFDGLDIFVIVKVNGIMILEIDNMFNFERVEVIGLLKEENEFVISFDSVYFRGWKLVEKYFEYKWGVWNGDNLRLVVRKVQYYWV